MPKLKKEPTSYNVAGVSVRERKNKNGTTTYQMRICKPSRAGEKQETEYNRSWCNKDKLCGKKLNDTLNQQVFEFKQQVEGEREQLLQRAEKATVSDYDEDTLFSTYAEYVLKIKEMEGVKHSTLARYKSLLIRIFEHIGDVKLKNITVSMLTEMNDKLSKTKLDLPDKAICKVELEDILKPYYITKVDIANVSGVSVQGVRSCYTTRYGSEKRNIELKSAELITKAINTLLSDKDKLRNTNRIRADKKLLPLTIPKQYKLKDLLTILPVTETLSAKTVQEYHRLTYLILEQALSEDLIDRNPAYKAKRPKYVKKEAIHFEADDINKMFEAIDLDIENAIKSGRRPPIKWKAILYLMLYTGCRRGEIAGLKWSCVDLGEGEITVEENCLYSSDKGTYSDTLKTKNAYRVVPIPQTVIDVLNEYKEYQCSNNGQGDRGYIFVQPDGKPINPSTITSWCRDFYERHHLNHINPHAFRHTYGTLLMRDGKYSADISHTMGHSSLNVTNGFYNHANKKPNRALAARLDEIIKNGQK